MNKDLEQLNLLKNLYYIYGGISIVFYCALVFYLLLASTVLLNEGNEDYIILLVFTVIIFVYGVLGSIATVLVGRFVKQHKNYIYCLIIAGFNFISFPIGVALSIFTLVILLRNSVKELFGKSIEIAEY